MTSTAKQNILNGANFYGSYYHEPIKTLNDSSEQSSPAKLQNISKSQSQSITRIKSRAKTQPESRFHSNPRSEEKHPTIDYARKQKIDDDETNIGGWIFWGILIFVIYYLLS